MIEVSHIVAYTTPAVVVVGGGRWLLGIVWRRGERVLEGIREESKERQDSIDEKLSRIEVQTLQTNGRVTSLETRIERVETTAAILHDVVVAAIKKADI